MTIKRSATLLLLFTLFSAPLGFTQTNAPLAAEILASVRRATGGDAWNHVFNRAGIVIDPMEQGQEVMTILPGSPGEAAGLAAGDIITAIDSHPPSDDPVDPAFLRPVGTVVHLTVKRGDEVRKIDVTLRDLF